MIKQDETKTHNINHEHLAGISQHDWYIGCFETNSATRLEDVTYRVMVQEQGRDDNEILSFTNLHELLVWARY